MEAFTLYLLKSVIWLTGFALVFVLFLKNERFFLLNRAYLIAGILTSFLFPFISIRYTVILPALSNMVADDALISGIQNSNSGNAMNIGLLLFVFYLSGLFFVLSLIIKQCISVLRAIKKSETVAFNSVKLIRSADYASPFSFFSWVFVNPSITDVETKEIVNHELVHIRQKHWFDLLLIELLCMLQWFNPLVWIYIRLIKQNHEYLADEAALQQTPDPAVYRATLLNQIVGSPVISLTNSFNYSLNKKRFNMMKNIISSPYRKMKLLLILPVFAIVLYSFAIPEYIYSSVDESLGNNDPLSTTQVKEIKGTVIQQDGKPLQGAKILVEGITRSTLTDTKGYFRVENVPADSEIAVSASGFMSKVVKPDFTGAMTIKLMRDTLRVIGYSDNPQPPSPPPPLPPEKQEDVSSIGSPLPPPPPPSPPEKQEDVSSIGSPLPPQPPLSYLKIRGADRPLIMLDGKITDIEVDRIDPETIESVTVLKDKSATALYGEKGEGGVILIRSKKVNLLENTSQPLVVIDGNITNRDINSIPAEDIYSISVLKDNSAVNKYGEKGKDGVIEITTKKKADK